MAANDPNPNAPKSGGLWARLFSMGSEQEGSAAEPDYFEAESPAKPTGADPVLSLEDEEIEVVAEAVAELVAPNSTLKKKCPSCAALNVMAAIYCDDCGWLFNPSDNVPAGEMAAATAASAPVQAMATPAPVASAFVKGRYELTQLISERGPVSRFKGFDHESGAPVPVFILRGQLPELVEAVMPLEEDAPADVVEGMDQEEFNPGFDDTVPMAAITGEAPTWPSIAWEQQVLEKANHFALPTVMEAFVEGPFEYLIEEAPQGDVLWNAWDEASDDAGIRYGYLVHIAEALQALHEQGAMIEGIRPDLIHVNEQGQACLADLTDLLPLALPPNTPLRANLYTAPELVLTPQQADARADLYSFGGLIYSLEYLGHALEEKDFERPFYPRLITDRYPDVHPALFRLISKTFTRDLNTRFPTDEAGREDPTGFAELIKTLQICQRTFDNVRLDIACWTTTGMVRTGNEDAFGILHCADARLDDVYEYSLVILCDGMGGYEAGEVAAAMAIASMKKFLLQQPMFAALTGQEPTGVARLSIDDCKKALFTALKSANKEIYQHSRGPGRAKRTTMGCTADVVYVDNRNLVVGHVGDSRVYHLHQGRLIQLTRDQTLVNRLVELGKLTAEEAEEHPRKNELQQAVGGQPDVEPAVYHGQLKRGDWVLVCSDGLTNHVPTEDLRKMFREAAGSAEEAARRLLNLVNLRGATDNATIVCIRAT